MNKAIEYAKKKLQGKTIYNVIKEVDENGIIITHKLGTSKGIIKKVNEDYSVIVDDLGLTTLNLVELNKQYINSEIVFR